MHLVKEIHSASACTIWIMEIGLKLLQRSYYDTYFQKFLHAPIGQNYSPVNILELCLSDAGLGGLELYFLNTFRRFGNAGHFCCAVVRRETTLSKQFDEGEEVIFLDPSSRYFPLINAHKLAGLIDKHSIDILHMHWAKDLAIAVWAKKLSKRKPRLIYTRHMAFFSSRHNFYHRMMYREVDRIYTITEQMHRQAIEFLPIDKHKIETLYLGVDVHIKPRDICDNVRTRFSINKDEIVVGLVGRIEPAKGQLLLVDAISILASRGKKVHALIVGTSIIPGYIDSLVSKASSLGVGDQIHFTGFHSSPTELMNCTDLCVLTTAYETFGLVLIEAMSVGKPVIGTNRGGVPEIIDDGVNGFLVEPKNADALAAKIEELAADDEKRKRFSQQARKKVINQFDIDNHYQKLETSLVAESRAQS